MSLPGCLLKHAGCLVGDFLVHASLLGGVDFSSAELLLGGVKACRGD